MNQAVKQSKPADLGAALAARLAKPVRKLSHSPFHSRYHATIGSDPELFIVGGDGKMMPAFTFLGPDSKDGNDRTPFWDGYQAEYRTHADTCLEVHQEYVGWGIAATLDRARKVDPRATVSVKTVMDVSLEELENENPLFTAFGCTPSLSAYGEKRLRVNSRTVPFRSAGGHMHFTLAAGMDPVTCVKRLDAVLGVVSVGLFQKYDDPRRRHLYGKAGEYRLTKYGIEYRVLSNAWLVHPALHMFVYEMARRVLGTVNAGVPDEEFAAWWDITEDEARTCINRCDARMARALLERNAGQLLHLLNLMPSAGAAEEWVRLIYDGVHTALRTPDKLSSAWNGFEKYVPYRDDDYDDDEPPQLWYMWGASEHLRATKYLD